MKEKKDLEHLDKLNTEDLELMDLDLELENLEQPSKESVQQLEENIEKDAEVGKPVVPEKRKKRKGLYKEYAVIAALALALLAGCLLYTSFCAVFILYRRFSGAFHKEP